MSWFTSTSPHQRTPTLPVDELVERLEETIEVVVARAVREELRKIQDDRDEEAKENVTPPEDSRWAQWKQWLAMKTTLACVTRGIVVVFMWELWIIEACALFYGRDTWQNVAVGQLAFLCIVLMFFLFRAYTSAPSDRAASQDVEQGQAD